MEFAERLRPAFPGAVEHDDSLSIVADLPSGALALVAEFLLRCAFVPGGTRDVLSIVSLDEKSFRCRCRRCGVRIQWPDPQLPDVSQQYGRSWPAALGRVAG